MGEMADAFAKAHENLSALERESAERKALRESKQGVAEVEAREALAKQGAISQRFAEHRAELGKRSREAGGWQTSASLRDRTGNMRLGFEGDEEQPEEDQFANYRAPAATPRPVQPPPPPPPAPAAPAPAAQAPTRNRRAARPTDDDDDDMSGQSWMR